MYLGILDHSWECNRKNSFLFGFWHRTMIPMDIEMPTYRTQYFKPDHNGYNLRVKLDLLEERQDVARLRTTAYQQRSARYYNSKVRHRILRIGDLVLRKVTLNTKEHGVGSLGPTWEGPYKIVKVVRPGTFKLEDRARKEVLRPRNVEHVKYYYQ